MTNTERFGMKYAAVCIAESIAEIAVGVFVGNKVKDATDSTAAGVAAGFGTTLVTSRIVNGITAPIARRKMVAAACADMGTSTLVEDISKAFEDIVGTSFDDIDEQREEKQKAEDAAC